MKKSVIIFLLLCIGIAEAKSIKVLLFYPRSEPFWDRLVLLAEAAADLKIDLESINGNENHIFMLKTLKQKIEKEKPDVDDKKLTKQNVKKINFKKYSKKYNGGKPYTFSLDSILKQL